MVTINEDIGSGKKKLTNIDKHKEKLQEKWRRKKKTPKCKNSSFDNVAIRANSSYLGSYLALMEKSKNDKDSTNHRIQEVIHKRKVFKEFLLSLMDVTMIRDQSAF